MPALPTGTTQEGYYGDSSLWGAYQFTTLQDIINNFLLMYTGDDVLIPGTINRDIVIFHAKRGLQELNYDALRRIKALELDIDPDTLQITVPEDFINYVRISWIDDAGKFHPLVTNEDTKISEAYLQDNTYAILFDESGNVLKASQNSYDETLIDDGFTEYTYDPDDNVGARFGLNTRKANSNGWVTIDKPSGVIKFASVIGEKTIVMEYISDGLESSTLSDVKVHKFAEEALYAYIEWQILSRLRQIQEYVVRRKHKYFHTKRLQAKSRLGGLRYEDLYQELRGRDQILK